MKDELELTDSDGDMITVWPCTGSRDYIICIGRGTGVRLTPELIKSLRKYLKENK